MRAFFKAKIYRLQEKGGKGQPAGKGGKGAKGGKSKGKGGKQERKRGQQCARSERPNPRGIREHGTRNRKSPKSLTAKRMRPTA